jgi:predicted transcriptional regulator
MMAQIWPANEKHYSVDEIAKEWGLSRDTIRRLFMNEDGVLKICRPGTRYKRAHTTLRIPESVKFRVHLRLSTKAA